jgi:hypothetical protein
MRASWDYGGSRSTTRYSYRGAIALDRGGDVSGIDLLPVVGQTRNLMRGEILRHHAAIVSFADNRVVNRVPTGLEHLMNEAIDLGQRLGRRRLEVVLELLPLTLPFVLIQARLDHLLLRSRSDALSNPSRTLVTVHL